MPIKFIELNPDLGGTAINEDVNSGLLFYNEFIPNFLDKDVWVNAHTYSVGDIVYDSIGLQYYICKTTHVSDTSIDLTKFDVYTNTVKMFNNIEEVEAYGINSSDTNVNWKYEYYHIQAFFNQNINAKLYLRIVQKPSVSVAAIEASKTGDVDLTSGYTAEVITPATAASLVSTIALTFPYTATTPFPAQMYIWIDPKNGGDHIELASATTIDIAITNLNNNINQSTNNLKGKVEAFKSDDKIGFRTIATGANAYLKIDKNYNTVTQLYPILGFTLGQIANGTDATGNVSYNKMELVYKDTDVVGSTSKLNFVLNSNLATKALILSEIQSQIAAATSINTKVSAELSGNYLKFKTIGKGSNETLSFTAQTVLMNKLGLNSTLVTGTDAIFIGKNYDFEEVYDMQVSAEGVIRQIGIFANANEFSTASLVKLQAIEDRLANENMPLFIVYGAKYDTYTTLSKFPDLTELSVSCLDVHNLIGMDASGKGYALSSTNNVAIGSLLGAISKAKVNENPAWIGGFDYMTEDDMQTVQLANGIKIKGLSVSEFNILSNKAYGIFYKENGKTGTFLNQGYTCDKKRVVNGLEQVRQLIPYRRTIHKVKRLLRLQFLPYVNYAFEVANNGSLSGTSVVTISTLLEGVLGKMKSAGELNQYSYIIDNTSNVLATGKISIAVKLVPFAYAKEIEISLQYAITV